MKNCFQGGTMIGIFDLNFEKQIIKTYAEETYEFLIDRADSRQLEKDFVFQEFSKQLNSLAKKNGIL